MTDQTDHTPKVAYPVPATVADMRPPKPSSLITEGASFLRAHWEGEAKPLFEILSGEKPSEHGSFALDEAAAVFELKKVAKEDGYAFLGNLKSNIFRRVIRFAYRRNTGVPMRLLVKQYRQLQITHQQPE
jgi:hypothetical protein